MTEIIRNSYPFINKLITRAKMGFVKQEDRLSSAGVNHMGKEYVIKTVKS